MTREDFSVLETQLSCPIGELGKTVAKQMDISNRSMTLSAIQALNIANNNKVLEVGHGNAGHAASLLSQSKYIKYYGIEISETMFKEAQIVNIEHINNGQAFFSHYNGKKLPFQDNFFDSIFTVNTIYFWENPIAFLNELKRVLRPKGTLVICFATKEFMEQLPFVKDKFTLYNERIFLNLIENSSLNTLPVALESSTEEVKSKTDNWVQREYITAILKSNKL